MFGNLRSASTLLAMSTLQIIYASTSGHTEYVIDTVIPLLEKGGITVKKTRVEKATAEDLTSGDALLLASGTWNTGGSEGQLNPHMHAFVWGPAKSADLKRKPVAIVALGDERYRYTAKAGEHLRTFVESHGGKVLGESLKIINEPYGQEHKIMEWGQALVNSFIR